MVPSPKILYIIRGRKDYETLYENIDRRVDIMLENATVSEQMDASESEADEVKTYTLKVIKALSDDVSISKITNDQFFEIERQEESASTYLMFDMLVGRLELFPMLVLFSPYTWKRKRL